MLPPVRIAPARELAAAVLAAPLLRQAQRLARWVGTGKPLTARGGLREADAAQAITELDIAAEGPGDVRELDLIWQTAVGAGLVVATGQHACARHDVLQGIEPETVLAAWRGALDSALRTGPVGLREELEGLATVLYAAGRPVRMEALAEAFAAAVRARSEERALDPQARMSRALEVLADLGVAEVGLDAQDEHLTVALTALGVVGMRDRLIAAGFSAPVTGFGAASGAAGLLAALAGYDAEDGEHEIAAWLAQRTPQQAAAELLETAGASSPGARGAAFAILDRLGKRVIPLVQSALAHPVLRAHAAIWLRERGVHADLTPAERAWLLVDLGVGLLEDADPQAAAADLLPDLPGAEQAELVSGLWKVSHPGLIGLLTTLAEHHPDPDVIKAARKAALKARSQHLGAG